MKEAVKLPVNDKLIFPCEKYYKQEENSVNKGSI